jgi:RNA-directed DNA polymerase
MIIKKQMMNYQDINWKNCQDQLATLQEALVKANRLNKAREIKNLQRSIVTSFAARALAVRRVTTNKGGKTPGIDGIKWEDSKMKIHAIEELRHFTQNPDEYRAQPLKKVDILSQKINKVRKKLLHSHFIPTLRDRAMQMVYLYSIDPLLEDPRDHNSYGFRPYGSAREAMGKICDLLGKDYSPNWVQYANIEICAHDTLHKWLMKHVPIVDKQVLENWLLRTYYSETSRTKAYGLLSLPTEITSNTKEDVNFSAVPALDFSQIDFHMFHIILPTLVNIMLNGVEERAQECTVHMVPRPKRTKVYLIGYANEFIVTGANKEILDTARAGIEAFLEPRGLRLHPNNTQVVELGVFALAKERTTLTYLGFEFSKKLLNLKLNMPSAKNQTKQRLVVRPSKGNIIRLKSQVKAILTTGKPIAGIIKELNPKLRAWSNYFRVGRHSPKVFKTVGNWLWRRMLKWAQKKHSTRNVEWIKNKYISKSKWRTNHWCDKGKHTPYLLDISTVPHMFVPTFPKNLNPYIKKDKVKLESRAQEIVLGIRKNSKTKQSSFVRP